MGIGFSSRLPASGAGRAGRRDEDMIAAIAKPGEFSLDSVAA
jgi:hypothetical protein